jgi:endonuclease YncB( thermonuclease family)
MPFLWLALILAGAAWIMDLPNMGGSWQAGPQRFTICGQGRSEACVIDGDTIVIGYPPDARKIRMSDYNAPELTGECPAESALALEARGVLLDWLNRGAFEMSGGDDPPYDKYGRELRALKRTGPNGSDDWLLDTMLASKTANSEWGDRGGGWCNPVSDNNGAK